MASTIRTPAEHGALLAAASPPLTAEQIEAAARILATVERTAGEETPPEARHSDGS